MFTYKAEQFVPRFILRDKTGYALAKAIEAAVQYMNDKVRDGLDILYDYDKMPEWRLDELAWEYNCFYDYSADIESKRAAIKGSMSAYSRMGTRAGVLSAIQTAYPDCTLSEWPETGGAPYTFRASIAAETEAAAAAKIKFITAGIAWYKNTRSELEKLIYSMTSGQAQTYAGFALAEWRQIRVPCEEPASLDVFYLTDENGAYLLDENGYNIVDEEGPR